VAVRLNGCEGVGLASANNVRAARAAITEWLRGYVAELIGVAEDEVDDEITFDRFGLDSSAAVALTEDVAAWLGVEVDPAATYDFPTIATFAEALANRSEVRAAMTAAGSDEN
jgi:acyl carrier protein